MKQIVFIFALGFLLLPGAQRAQAQSQVELGPRIGYDFDDIEELFIGADFRISRVDLPVVINPGFDYYFVGEEDGVEGNAWTLDVNALYEFGVDNQAFTPYAGGGLIIVRASVENGREVDDTGLGLNVVGGAVFETESNIRPFAQLKFTIAGGADLGDDIQPFTIGGGILFGVGN